MQHPDWRQSIRQPRGRFGFSRRRPGTSQSARHRIAIGGIPHSGGLRRSESRSAGVAVSRPGTPPSRHPCSSDSRLARSLCVFLPQPSEPQIVQLPAYANKRVQHFVEHVLKPETVEFVGVTPIFEGGFVFVEDCPQSLADRYWGVWTRWVSYLGKFFCQQLLDRLGQSIMQPCQIVAMRRPATSLVVSDCWRSRKSARIRSFRRLGVVERRSA